MERKAPRPETINEMFRNATRAEIEKDEATFRQLLIDIDTDVPTIREKEFVTRYLPHMANWRIPFPWGHWVREVSRMAANHVNVINDADEIVCVIPPLCTTDGLQQRDYVPENSIYHLSGEAYDEAQRMPHIGEKVFFAHLVGHIRPQTSDRWAGAWDKVLKHYGYPTREEIIASLKGEESKKTTSINSIDESDLSMYDEGDLL